MGNFTLKKSNLDIVSSKLSNLGIDFKVIPNCRKNPFFSFNSAGTGDNGDLLVPSDNHVVISTNDISGNQFNKILVELGLVEPINNKMKRGVRK